jgi:ribosomal-protein-alanine N-acetyltransferase
MNEAGKTVRPRLAAAGRAQVPVLAALHAECFAGNWSRDSFADLVASPGTLAWLALDGDQPVGMLLARIVAGEGEIITVGVAPGARRRGVARHLLAHALAAAGAAGCRMMFLEVGCGNEAALALYRAAGFRAVGRRRNYYQDGAGAVEDAIVMRKDY